MPLNEYGQPVGELVSTPPARPLRAVHLRGRDVTVVDLADDHLPALYERLCGPQQASAWTYMAGGPFPDPDGFTEYTAGLRTGAHPVTLLTADGPAGMAAYLNRTDTSIEVGHIVFGPTLARTRAATEAMYLMARHAFDDLGHRRYEWKCNSLNAPSRRAAARLGFAYEGTFAQHLVVRGRNRDTAWFSVTDVEWPAVRAAQEAWLHPDTFDAAGRQRRALRCPVGHREHREVG